MPHPPNANLDTCVHEGGLTSHSFQAWVSYIVTPKVGVISRRGKGLLSSPSASVSLYHKVSTLSMF